MYRALAIRMTHQIYDEQAGHRHSNQPAIWMLLSGVLFLGGCTYEPQLDSTVVATYRVYYPDDPSRKEIEHRQLLVGDTHYTRTWIDGEGRHFMERRHFPHSPLYDFDTENLPDHFNMDFSAIYPLVTGKALTRKGPWSITWTSVEETCRVGEKVSLNLPAGTFVAYVVVCQSGKGALNILGDKRIYYVSPDVPVPLRKIETIFASSDTYWDLMHFQVSDEIMKSNLNSPQVSGR